VSAVRFCPWPPFFLFNKIKNYTALLNMIYVV